MADPLSARAASPEGPAPAEDRATKLPSLSQQLKFIIDNSAAVLNRETKMAILSLVMMEIGPSVILGSTTGEVNVDLDAVAKVNAEVLAHIYNIVHTRLKVLSQPAGVARS